MIVPKHFFTVGIIEKRERLKDSAQRAGWIGCNIRISKIPDIGKIDIIREGQPLPEREIVEKYKKTTFIADYKSDMRGWISDIVSCVERIESRDFSLEQMYGYADKLQIKYPDNHHVKDKIRQQLQILRGHGLIGFVKRGHYKKPF